MAVPFKEQIRRLASRPALQPVWLALAKLSYAGMNYGGGQMVEGSGELRALQIASQAAGSSEPFTLFDVGANIGSYLEAALGFFGERVSAYSFEPQPFNVRLLEQRFGRDPRVVLVSAALGSEVTTAPLFFNIEGEPTASLRDPGGSSRSHTVPVTTVDRVCAEHRIERIDMLKIDAEGLEMEVLLGASAMLEQDRVGAIQFEFGETFVGTPYHFRDLYDLLAPRYRIYRILRQGLAELPRYSYDLEVYKLANFLCVHKQSSGTRA